MKKNAKQKLIDIKITPKTELGEIYQFHKEETKRIIKQMEAYGFHPVGYGVNYSNTIEEHATEQSLSPNQLKNMLKSINKKL
jgi:hypothetical protein